jgi:hypothetical protein
MLKVALCAIVLFGSLGAHALGDRALICREVNSVDLQGDRLWINGEYYVYNNEQNASLLASALNNPGLMACVTTSVWFGGLGFMDLVSIRPIPPPPVVGVPLPLPTRPQYYPR